MKDFLPNPFNCFYITFFGKTLNNWEASNNESQQEFIKCIPKLIAREVNKLLNSSFQTKRYWNALFQTKQDKALDPDGLQANIFFPEILAFSKGWTIGGNKEHKEIRKHP